MYVCIYVCMHVCMHACMCVCMCMLVEIWAMDLRLKEEIEAAKTKARSWECELAGHETTARLLNMCSQIIQLFCCMF